MTALAVDSSVAELRDRVRDAAARGAALRVVGRGTWLDAGRPVAASETISTRDLSGVVEYVPGDLTMTVRAGTTLAEIRDATAAHNQWLALDPHGTDEGTIGATVATASAGPLATFFGTPRDLVLGLEFVAGTAAVARGGGRVVKNVAGFDLTRLLTGSWGTLGVITEVTVRLHARPEVDVSLSLPIDEGDVERVRALLRRVPFRPFACEVVSEPSPAALFRLAGNREAVAAQRTALTELGNATEIDPDAWTTLRASEPANAMVVRLSDLPSEIGRTWSEASRVEGAFLQASPLRGIVRLVVPTLSEAKGRDLLLTQAVDKIRSLAPLGTTVVAERLPAGLWSLFPPSHSALSSRVKSNFDPSNVLNPGILGDAS